MRQPLIAGNWKMYKSIAEARTFLKSLRARLDTVADRQVVVCPPFTTLSAAAEELKGSPILLGAQNAHWEKQGAFTGEIAVAMLAEVGCRFTIIGHSERRQYFGETDATVHKRLHAVVAGGLTPIVCIGETLQERESNQTWTVLERQIKTGLVGLSKPGDSVIAYEPVWAIGTGKTATPDQAQEAHAFIRKQFALLYGDPAAQAVRILYGGSVKPDNAGALMKQPDIDGGLVGGACLEVDSFSKIVLYDAAVATGGKVKLAIGSDHAGFDMRHALVAWLRTPEGGKHQVLDLGCGSPESCDYPDFAAAVARTVSAKRVARGILICGTGIGMAMAANKVKGIRAAVAWNLDVAGLAAEHNKANVLCLPARYLSTKEAETMVHQFLTTPFGGGRHQRRVRKIDQLLT